MVFYQPTPMGSVSQRPLAESFRAAVDPEETSAFLIWLPQSCRPAGSVLTYVQIRLRAGGGHGKRLIVETNLPRPGHHCHDHRCQG
jgi:hypothetical protein